LKVLATKQEAWEIPVHKNDEVVAILIEIRDMCEDALDVLNPPPVDEQLELPTSEAPSGRGVAESDGTQLPKRGKRSKNPTPR